LKYLVQILLFLVFSFFGRTQNLITNPSFEDIDSCYGQPAGIGFDVFEWSGCNGWSCPSNASSDLWCQNPIIGNVFPPIIGGDYQNALSGNNFSAILVGDVIENNYREFLQNELIIPLEPFSIYKFSCWISASSLPCTTSSFGISVSDNHYFSNEIYKLKSNIIGLNSEVNYITDTLGWEKIEIEFIATSKSKFIQFGSFTDNLSLNSIGCENSSTGNFEVNYYFLEDFELIKIGEFQLPNIISLQSSVNNNRLDFSKFKGDWKVEVLNRWGNKIISLNEINPIWIPQSNEINDGVYFLYFEHRDFHAIQYLTIIK
jgi:hypothetical protein